MGRTKAIIRSSKRAMIRNSLLEKEEDFTDISDDLEEINNDEEIEITYETPEENDDFIDIEEEEEIEIPEKEEKEMKKSCDITGDSEDSDCGPKEMKKKEPKIEETETDEKIIITQKICDVCDEMQDLHKSVIKKKEVRLVDIDSKEGLEFEKELNIKEVPVMIDVENGKKQLCSLMDDDTWECEDGTSFDMKD